MKLTEEQKQTICDVYERALELKEKYSKKPLLVAFEIDHYQNFEIRVYQDEFGHLTRLAGDMVKVYDAAHCIQAMEELAQYCETFLNNREAATKARIKALEEELANLKNKED